MLAIQRNRFHIEMMPGVHVQYYLLVKKPPKPAVILLVNEYARVLPQVGQVLAAMPGNLAGVPAGTRLVVNSINEVKGGFSPLFYSVILEAQK